MRTIEYEQLRDWLQLNASPVGPDRLGRLADDLRRALATSSRLHSVEADRSGDADRLVIAMAAFPPDLDEAEVAVELERLWQRLHFDFWEAHTLLVEPGQVELQGATREAADGRYFTLHLVAQAAEVPAQRTAPAPPAATALPGQRRRLFGRSRVAR